MVLVSLLYASSLVACEEDDVKFFLSKLKWITEDYPPYNYRNELNELVGIFPEILPLIYDELGINIDIEEVETLPWARLLMYMERYPQYAAFSMVKTPERTAKFKLVALPILTKISIITLGSNFDLLQHQSVNDLIIAVVREDIGQRLLTINKISAKQVETSSAASMLKMLLLKRVDAIAYSEDVANFQFNKLETGKNAISPIYLLSDKLAINFVFHKETPNCVINFFEKKLKLLNERGVLDSIMTKYVSR